MTLAGSNLTVLFRSPPACSLSLDDRVLLKHDLAGRSAVTLAFLPSAAAGFSLDDAVLLRYDFAVEHARADSADFVFVNSELMKLASLAPGDAGVFAGVRSGARLPIEPAATVRMGRRMTGSASEKENSSLLEQSEELEVVVLNTRRRWRWSWLCRSTGFLLFLAAAAAAGLPKPCEHGGLGFCAPLERRGLASLSSMERQMASRRVEENEGTWAAAPRRRGGGGGVLCFSIDGR